MGRTARVKSGKRGAPSKGPTAPILGTKSRRLLPTRTRNKGRFRVANEEVGLDHIIPKLALATPVIWDSRTKFGKLKGIVVTHKVRFPATPSMTDIQCKIALEASPFDSFDEVWVSESSEYLEVDKTK